MLLAAILAAVLLVALALWDISTDRAAPVTSWRCTFAIIAAMFAIVIFAIALSVMVAP
jgi:hypothetical protein